MVKDKKGGERFVTEIQNKDCEKTRKAISL